MKDMGAKYNIMSLHSFSQSSLLFPPSMVDVLEFRTLVGYKIKVKTNSTDPGSSLFAVLTGIL